jgi:hypothetical protein
VTSGTVPSPKSKSFKRKIRMLVPILISWDRWLQARLSLMKNREARRP